jgi:acetolactate synthase-1/3 small subunit
MMLVKVTVPRGSSADLKQLVDIFRGNIIDAAEPTYTVELTGSGKKLDAFLENLEAFDVVEVVRSGPLGIARGSRHLHV